MKISRVGGTKSYTSLCIARGDVHFKTGGGKRQLLVRKPLEHVSTVGIH
jgi:hypothetical protein